MRITAGRLRGKTLAVPEGRAIRPTADRTRQSLFNIIDHGRAAKALGVTLRGARVLDAFAGTGALGLEALSRGAAHVTFIDNARIARQILLRNIASCSAEDATDILRADVSNPPPAKHPVDVAFLDPPYGKDLLMPALDGLRQTGWLSEQSLIVAEMAADEDIAWPEYFEQLDVRRYGAARIVFLSLAPN